MKKDRATFMNESQKVAMGTQARTHANCKALTGVQRPGKTAKDRAATPDSEA